MSIKIYSTKNVHENGIKVLVYGKSGAGKTTLMGTAPKPIILSCEGGLLALKEKNIPYITVNTMSEIDDALEYLDTRESRKLYKTICLDSISEMAEVILSEMLKSNKDGRKAYQEFNTAMAAMIRNFRDIKRTNVIFSAKRQRVVDEDTGLTQYIPSMPGKSMLNFLPYQFDEVFYMTFKETVKGGMKRVLYTKEGLEHDAKDRSGSLLGIERPNLTNIFNKIKLEK